MKKSVPLLLLSLCLALAGCGRTPYEPSAEIDSVEYVSLIDTTNFETLVQYSSNIVEATLASASEFSEGIIQYVFTSNTDYTNNTPEEIYLYAPYHSAYVEGHDYCLFMQGSENALYPHTIYSTVNKNLILDCTDRSKCGELYHNAEEVSLLDVPAAIQEAVSNGSVGTALPASGIAEAPSADRAGTAFDEADAIVKVRFGSEQKANPYVSVYGITKAETIKGPAEAVSSYICLAPDLEEDTEYYLLLKEDPAAPGTYLPLGGESSIVSAQELDMAE